MKNKKRGRNGEDDVKKKEERKKGEEGKSGGGGGSVGGAREEGEQKEIQWRGGGRGRREGRQLRLTRRRTLSTAWTVSRPISHEIAAGLTRAPKPCMTQHPHSRGFKTRPCLPAPSLVLFLAHAEVPPIPVPVLVVPWPLSPFEAPPSPPTTQRTQRRPPSRLTKPGSYHFWCRINCRVYRQSRELVCAFSFHAKWLQFFLLPRSFPPSPTVSADPPRCSFCDCADTRSRLPVPRRNLISHHEVRVPLLSTFVCVFSRWSTIIFTSFGFHWIVLT